MKKPALSYRIISAAVAVVAIATILALNSALFVLNYEARAQPVDEARIAQLLQNDPERIRDPATGVIEEAFGGT